MTAERSRDDTKQFDHLTVRAEVWPVAADEVGIWLLSGDDAWRSSFISTDGEPHSAVERLLDEGHASPELMHSTSWRMDGGSVILTYVAIVDCASPVRESWPEARPISAEVLAAVGKPLPTPPTGLPMPRYIDVLAHAIRHIRFLMDTDTEARSAMDERWQTYLKELSPTLTGMYERDIG